MYYLYVRLSEIIVFISFCELKTKFLPNLKLIFFYLHKIAQIGQITKNIHCLQILNTKQNKIIFTFKLCNNFALYVF